MQSNYSGTGGGATGGGGGSGRFLGGRPTTTTGVQQGLPRSSNYQQQLQQQMSSSNHSSSSQQQQVPFTSPGVGNGVGGGRTDPVAPRRNQPARVQFCPGRRDVYGSVNTQPPEQEQQPLQAQQQQNAQISSTVDSTATSRVKKPGPVLLELRLLRPESDPALRKAGRCLSSRTIAISRGNPSLGGGVASTCLSFRPNGIGGGNKGATAVANAAGGSNNGNKGDTVQCATGLTSGALCLHTFFDFDGFIGNTTNSAEGSGGDKHIHSTVAYYAPRHHRPAMSVAWRPGPTASELRHVAVGLTGSGGGDRGGTTHGGGAYPRGSRVAGSALHGSGGAAGGMAMAGSGGGYGGSGHGGGGGGGGGGGDREFCCLVWDIEAQRQGTTTTARAGQVPVKTPVYRYAHNTAVSSLSWLSSGNLLAVGTQNRGAVQLYDLRVSGTNAPPVSIYAHSDAVGGIEADPHRPNVFATFGRGAKEPVKLWDARRMDACLGEIKMSEGESVSAVAWSTHPDRSGTLMLAVGDALKMYDTSVSGSRPALTGMRHCPASVQSVAFQPGVPGSDSAVGGSPVSREDASAEFYPHRMLAVQGDATVRDMATYQVAPVEVSKRDGKVAFCLGRAAWIGSEGEVPSVMDGSTVRPTKEDISATIMRRARALHSARYSMEAGPNLVLLCNEKKATSNSGSGSWEDAAYDPKNEELIRLWRWIERVEFLCSERDDAAAMADELPPWPARGLTDAGVYKLLRMDVENSDTVSRSETLGCDVYESPFRRAALNACGLLGKFGFRDVLAESEARGNFERSAALAVWHGDLGAAVAALQHGADRIRLKLTEEKESGKLQTQAGLSSAQYAETLQLVAMCIAGFRPSTEADSNSAAVWRQSCEGLLQQRQDLLNEKERTANVPYLRATCVFLLNIGKADGLDKILYEDTLSLSDRVAFACMFLSKNALKEYLDACISQCQERGNLEGIIITGLDKRGMLLLQGFVDTYSDVQTAALISSRVILPNDWVTERALCSEWLDSYRDLLNTFSMWQSRAMFDVGRSELLRSLKGRQAADDLAPMAAGSMSRVASQGRRGYSSAQQGRVRQPIPGSSGKQAEAATDIVANYPPQLYARCNYCNTSLPLSRLRRQEGIASGWLSRQKSVLSCCPSCRKPLPRCALCLLPLGCLNPYMELKRERNRISRTGQSVQETMDDLSDLSNLPFAEWFTWCMRCKHGGHAHHLVGWFAKHETCPVSGCDCQCQFDGLQNLPRHAVGESCEDK